MVRGGDIYVESAYILEFDMNIADLVNEGIDCLFK